MSLPQNVADAFAKVDTATNALAVVVRGLRDQIKTSLTPADVQLIQAKLDAVATSLDGIAADPNNPVPTPTP